MSRSADSGTPSSVALLTFARDRGIFVLFVLIILLFAIWAGAIFASFDNAMLVVSAAAVTAIMALGVVVGVANGLITLQGLNPLVVTIGTLSVLSGIAAVITQGEPIGGLDSLAFLGTDHLWKIPSSAFVVAGLYLIGWILLTRTRAGVRLLAVRRNAEAARRVGVARGRQPVP